MKKLSLKRVAAVVLVAVLGLVAGDLTLREQSDVKAAVELVKSKVESLLEDEATADTPAETEATSEEVSTQ